MFSDSLKSQLRKRTFLEEHSYCNLFDDWSCTNDCRNQQLSHPLPIPVQPQQQEHGSDLEAVGDQCPEQGQRHQLDGPRHGVVHGVLVRFSGRSSGIRLR